MDLHAYLMFLLSTALTLLVVIIFRRFAVQRKKEMYSNRRGRTVFDLPRHDEDSAEDSITAGRV